VSKFTRKPKTEKTQAVEEFVNAAGQAETIYDVISNDTESYSMKSYPWQDARVRDDVQKVYNLRLAEPYLLKLKYIAEHSPISMQRFCLNALLPAIDAHIEQLLANAGKESGGQK
jgi:hypothetical protein